MAPAIARGTVKRMVNGSRKLSNCAASVKYTSINAKMKISPVLLELSAKSEALPAPVFEDTFPLIF